jgi:hypothetical protein
VKATCGGMGENIMQKSGLENNLFLSDKGFGIYSKVFSHSRIL